MIRHAAPDDKDTMLEVAIASGLFEQHEVEVLIDMLNQHFDAELAAGTWLIDHDDQQAVGVAYFEPERMTQGTYNLLMIAVRPEFQQQGRGTALLGHIESLLDERGARVMLVETMGIEAFEYVRAFYRKAGFREEARIRDYYAAGADKVVFWKAAQ